MSIYRIANINIQLDLMEKSVSLPSLKKYQTEESNADIRVTVNIIKHIPTTMGEIYNRTRFYDVFKKDNIFIQYQRKEKDLPYFGYIIYKDNEAEIYIIKDNFSEMQLNEYLLTQYVFPYYAMKLKAAIWMHGSSISYKNNGYLFSAPSGTGKSTHTRLWKELVSCETINDDKNIIMLENDELMLYGNPWSGKHHLDNNICAPLKAIIFLYQAKENTIREISKKEALMKIMPQIIQPFDNSYVDVWSKMIDELMKVPCYELGCNISHNAVETVINKLEESKNEN